MFDIIKWSQDQCAKRYISPHYIPHKQKEHSP